MKSDGQDKLSVFTYPPSIISYSINVRHTTSEYLHIREYSSIFMTMSKYSDICMNMSQISSTCV